jgi:hypothetical protein
MGDPKEAKKLLGEIPTDDSFRALEECTFWLDSITRTEGFKLDRKFELIDALDQIAKNHQRKLSHDYLQPRLPKFQENRLWTTVFDFWRNLGTGYASCVEGFQAGAAGAGNIKAELPAILCRAMRALTLQLKWLLLRYGPVEDRMWAELGRLYLFAESNRFATKSVQMYPGTYGTSTVQVEFLKAMMLASSSTDALVPARLEIAERTVAHFATQFVLESTPTDACTGYYDLAMRKPPSRLAKTVAATPTTRYFGAGAADDALYGLIRFATEQGVLPTEVNLGGTVEKDAVVEVWKHLASYWSKEPPARSSERKKATARLTVANGFAEIYRNIEPGAASSLDFLNDSSESWIVENVSDGGYGAIIPQVKGDWVRVGTLLGLKPDGAHHWGVGVIRRISRDEHQNRRVGIQLYTRMAIAVKLNPTGDVSSF